MAHAIYTLFAVVFTIIVLIIIIRDEKPKKQVKKKNSFKIKRCKVFGLYLPDAITQYVLRNAR